MADQPCTIAAVHLGHAGRSGSRTGLEVNYVGPLEGDSGPMTRLPVRLSSSHGCPHMDALAGAEMKGCGQSGYIRIVWSAACQL